jgi:hypothetical protein
MAKSKKMNELRFAKLQKELSAVGEDILTKQDEKQAVMNDFDTERARFLKGKISEDTLASSSKKTNNELLRLDKGIRENIVKISKISASIKEFVGMQSPKVFRASVKGIKMASNAGKKSAPKKASHKKAAKKTAKVSKTQLEKEKALDKKFS